MTLVMKVITQSFSLNLLDRNGKSFDENCLKFSDQNIKFPEKKVE